MKPKSIVIAVFAVLGVVAIGLGVLAGDGSEPDEAVAAAAGAGIQVPLAYLDGSSGDVSEFRGKPVVLNFWASWCPACVAELPDFEKVHQALGGEVVFIGMNMQEVDRAAADALIAQTGVTYRLADDPEGVIYRSFSGIAMPTTVLIDADGNVVDMHAGAIFADDLTELIRTELLGA